MSRVRRMSAMRPATAETGRNAQCRLWAQLLNLAIHGQPIDCDVALHRKIDDILVRQWIAQVPAHSAKG